MSKLSTWFHTVADFLTAGIKDLTPDEQTAVANITQPLKAAATAMDTALPLLAKTLMDSALVKVGVGEYVPDINAFYDLLIADIAARKTDGSTVTVVPKASGTGTGTGAS